MYPHCVEDATPFYVSCTSALNTLKALDKDFEFSQRPATCKYMYRFLLEKGYARPRVWSTFPQIDFRKVFRNIRDPFLDPLTLTINYKLAHDVVPVAYTLYLRNITPHKLCSFCNKECETVEHLFYFCPFIKESRQYLSIWFKEIAGFDVSPTSVRFSIFSQNVQLKCIQKMLFLLSEFRYSVWFQRNKARFDQKHVTSQQITGLFLYRIKSRVFVEYARLSRLEFEGLFCYNNFCQIGNNAELVFAF